MSTDRITAAVVVVCAIIWIVGATWAVKAYVLRSTRLERRSAIDWADVFGACFIGSLLGCPLFIGLVRAAIFAGWGF